MRTRYVSRICVALIAIFLMLLATNSFMSTAQQGGIGVDNDGPSFMDITIMERDDVTFVNVEVRDLNGWNDLFSINVTITDNQNNPISSVSYMQYSSLSSTSVATILWNETTGNYLDLTQSTWMPISVAPWNPDNALVEIGVRVSFAFQKFSGQNINILCMDRGQLTCEYNGPFSADYTPAPVFEGAVIPIGLSSSIAVAAAGILVFRRFKNNKLARSVEASHASGEE